MSLREEEILSMSDTLELPQALSQLQKDLVELVAATRAYRARIFELENELKIAQERVKFLLS